MNKSSTKKRGLIICRVSTEEQANRGASLESQENWATSEADMMEVEVAERISEQISGKTFPSENEARILDIVEKKGITHLFVYSFDRLSRNFPRGVALVDTLWSKDIVIVTSELTPNPSKKEDRLRVWFDLLFAEMELEGIHERTARGMITKLNRGEYCFSRIPFGCERVDLKLRVKPDYREVIAFVFTVFIRLRNYAGTARIVNEQYGRKMGFELKPRDITAIVRNKVYLGFLSWNGSIFGKGDENTPWEELRVVDEELFERAQEIARQIGDRCSKSREILPSSARNLINEYGAEALDILDNLQLLCPRCGSSRLQKNGRETINSTPQVKCICCNCGHEFRFPSGTQIRRAKKLGSSRNDGAVTCKKGGVSVSDPSKSKLTTAEKPSVSTQYCNSTEPNKTRDRSIDEWMA